MSVREMFQVQIPHVSSHTDETCHWVSRVAPCCNVNVTWPLIVVTFGPTDPHGHWVSLCVFRKVAPGSLPTLSLSLASNSLAVVRPRGLSPESGACDQTYGARKQLAENLETNVNHGTLTNRTAYHTAMGCRPSRSHVISIATLPHDYTQHFIDYQHPLKVYPCQF